MSILVTPHQLHVSNKLYLKRSRAFSPACACVLRQPCTYVDDHHLFGAKQWREPVVMSVLRAIHSRQTQLSGGNLSKCTILTTRYQCIQKNSFLLKLGSQRWIFEEHLECNYEDEVGLHGRLRGVSKNAA